GRAILRNVSFRYVDVQIERAMEVGVEAEPARARAHPGDRGLGRLAHRLSKPAGENELTRAGEQAHLDAEQLASRFAPGHSVRHSDALDRLTARLGEARRTEQAL